MKQILFFLNCLFLSSCQVQKTSEDPSRQNLTPNGMECAQNSDCRSNLCVKSNDGTFCFEQWGNQCLQLGPETSLPIRGELTLSCSEEKPQLQVCGFEVFKKSSRCEKITTNDPNLSLGGFKFYCCE